tara:strand:+ start:742 stop:1335 length:594 start_codon:yes stop_codon:yes gene_type:complete
MKISMERWRYAQDAEFEHHQDLRLEAYEKSHEIIAKYLNLNYEKDFKDKIIVEVGCAAQPHLLQCKSNFKKAYAIEPLIDRWPQEIKQNWIKNNITPINSPYETIDLGPVDETWFFNVVQHVLCPEEMLLKAKKTSKIIRVFESIDQQADIAHPHIITKNLFTEVLGDGGHIFKGGTEPGFHAVDCYYGTWYANNNI